uniref:Pumilio homolog 24-like n=1 Tax=Cicer arietinum TaxID=3827 RepID=A0A1S2YDY3_CICAR|nr:pumilio homolog 24-like [Cicer arietinum]
MAAKKQQVEDTKKRKRINTESHQSPSKPKASKFVASKKPKPHFDNKEKKNVPLTGRERRLNAKELAEARKKKRKRHFTLEQVFFPRFLNPHELGLIFNLGFKLLLNDMLLVQD